MTTPRIARSAAVLVCCAAMASPALAAQSAEVPSRHVICNKAQTWIPLAYDGGCYLRFSPTIRKAVYAAFASAAKSDAQWIRDPQDVVPLVPQWQAMRCTRGGKANGVALNRWQAGTCTWDTEVFGHRGYGDHADHEWQCRVVMVLRTSMNGKQRTRGGKLWMQWDVTATPLQDLQPSFGTYPRCGKDAPEDTWTGDIETVPLT